MHWTVRVLCGGREEKDEDLCCTAGKILAVSSTGRSTPYLMESVSSLKFDYGNSLFLYFCIWCLSSQLSVQSGHRGKNSHWCFVAGTSP